MFDKSLVVFPLFGGKIFACRGQSAQNLALQTSEEAPYNYRRNRDILHYTITPFQSEGGIGTILLDNLKPFGLQLQLSSDRFHSQN